MSNTHVRMLFVDFSSTFNTIIPHKLVQKLYNSGLSSSLCLWIKDFLINRPQVVRIGNNTSSALILNTAAPQGCVLSPVLFTLFTHDCTSIHASNTIVKSADDTTVVRLISNNDETFYREEIHHLDRWCSANNLVSNSSKTKEVVVDFRRSGRTAHASLLIQGVEVERVENIRFLDIHISADFTWALYTWLGKLNKDFSSSGRWSKLDSPLGYWYISIEVP